MNKPDIEYLNKLIKSNPPYYGEIFELSLLFTELWLYEHDSEEYAPNFFRYH